eukprot:6188359-Pleurochrysis_carterae.AAC.5
MSRGCPSTSCNLFAMLVVLHRTPKPAYVSRRSVRARAHGRRAARVTHVAIRVNVAAIYKLSQLQVQLHSTYNFTNYALYRDQRLEYSDEIVSNKDSESDQ